MDLTLIIGIVLLVGGSAAGLQFAGRGPRSGRGKTAGKNRSARSARKARKANAAHSARSASHATPAPPAPPRHGATRSSRTATSHTSANGTAARRTSRNTSPGSSRKASGGGASTSQRTGGGGASSGTGDGSRPTRRPSRSDDPTFTGNPVRWLVTLPARRAAAKKERAERAHETAKREGRTAAQGSRDTSTRFGPFGEVLNGVRDLFTGNASRPWRAEAAPEEQPAPAASERDGSGDGDREAARPTRTDAERPAQPDPREQAPEKAPEQQPRRVPDPAKVHPMVHFLVERINQMTQAMNEITNPEANRAAHQPAQTVPDPAPQAPATRPDDQDAPQATAQIPHLRAVPDLPDDPTVPAPAATSNTPRGTGGNPMTTPMNWAAIADEIRAGSPDTDTEILELFKAFSMGLTMIAEATQEYAESCIDAVGLDPLAIEGLGEVAESVSSSAAAVTLAEQKFRIIYGKIMDFVNNGGKLPFNGRFFSGDETGELGA